MDVIQYKRTRFVVKLGDQRVALIEKTPWEEFFLGASIEPVQHTGESITLSSTVTAYTHAGTDVSTTFLDAAQLTITDDEDGGTNNVLAAWVRGGYASFSPYRVVYKIVTSEGRKFQIDVDVHIRGTTTTTTTTTTA